MITYLRGDAARPLDRRHKVIVHIVNDEGRWGAGFTASLSRRWPKTARVYRAWANTEDFCLGAILPVRVEPDVTVVNMLAQRGVGTSRRRVDYMRLAECLSKTAATLRGEVFADLGQLSVHMPRIGCGLGGGHWSEVEPLVTRHLHGLPVFVYDL